MKNTHIPLNIQIPSPNGSEMEDATQRMTKIKANEIKSEHYNSYDLNSQIGLDQKQPEGVQKHCFDGFHFGDPLLEMTSPSPLKLLSTDVSCFDPILSASPMFIMNSPLDGLDLSTNEASLLGSVTPPIIDALSTLKFSPMSPTGFDAIPWWNYQHSDSPHSNYDIWSPTSIPCIPDSCMQAKPLPVTSEECLQTSPVELDFSIFKLTPHIEGTSVSSQENVEPSSPASDDNSQKSRPKDQERKFACPRCSKMFHKITNLRSHMNVHTTERKHSCQFCNAGFVRRHDMLRHVRNVHKQNIN